MREQSRFVRRRWSRRWLTLRPVLAALSLLAVVGAGVWLTFFSSVLAVSGVSVQGARLLSVQDVRSAAAVPTGEPLATVDLDAVRTRVESLREVDSADVSRSWPDHVRIAVTERTAVALVVGTGGYQAMDHDGVLFRTYTTRPPGLPLVRTGPSPGRGALAEAARVIEALPAGLSARVEHVSVTTIDRISLRLRGGRTVVWGSAEDSAAKAEVLAVLLHRKARVYDVSVPGQPTTRK